MENHNSCETESWTGSAVVPMIVKPLRRRDVHDAQNQKDREDFRLEQRRNFK